MLWLSALTGALAATTAAAGLLWRGGDGPFAYTSVRGQAVEIAGRGLYEFDTVLSAAGNRGTDLVTLAVAVPLLAVALLLYRRGSVRAGLLLLGALVWFLYYGAS